MIAATPAPSTTPTPSTPPGVAVRGQLLTATPALIVFTNGVAVRLGSATMPAEAVLGRTIRVTLDPVSHLARSVEIARAPSPGEVDAAHIPPEYVAPGFFGQGAAAGGAAAEIVPVLIEVLIPPSTPLGDDIYLTTERTSFSPAETKMNRVDAQRWSISLALPQGSVIRYRFTRGSTLNAERDNAGQLPAPRTLTVTKDAHTHDIVARWADQY